MDGQWSGAGLPPAAEARMAEASRSGTWGSALRVNEFAAIASAGFEPVGQVLGATVYHIGYTGGDFCTGGQAAGMVGGPMLKLSGLPGGPFGGQSSMPVSGVGLIDSLRPYVASLYQARRQALTRMITECSRLGGHGVVGVELDIAPFPAGGLEFKAIGTAIRAKGGGHPLEHPFTSDLTGQNFAKLIAAGWVPVGLALGIAAGARHDDWYAVSQTRWISGNAEVVAYSELVGQVRRDARNELELDLIRMGAEGVVAQDMTLRLTERECPSAERRRDHVAEATVIGTGMVRFQPSRPRPPRPVYAAVSLDPERRRALRPTVGQPPAPVAAQSAGQLTEEPQ